MFNGYLDPSEFFGILKPVMPEWRNWQTRTTQNRVPSGMWVQFPPSAPGIITLSPLKVEAGSVVNGSDILNEKFSRHLSP
jgi:hypothetical protein